MSYSLLNCVLISDFFLNFFKTQIGHSHKLCRSARNREHQEEKETHQLHTAGARDFKRLLREEHTPVWQSGCRHDHARTEAQLRQRGNPSVVLQQAPGAQEHHEKAKGGKRRLELGRVSQS